MAGLGALPLCRERGSLEGDCALGKAAEMVSETASEILVQVSVSFLLPVTLQCCPCDMTCLSMHASVCSRLPDPAFTCAT